MQHTTTAETLSRQTVRLLLQRMAPGRIPASIRHQMRQHIADAVAIGLAATRCQPLAQQLGDAMTMGAHGGACGVLGSAQRHAPSLAAFTNAALIHTLDFDDIHDAARLHPTAVTLPAALAAADLVGAPGAQVLSAVALGNELLCRLGVMYSPMGSGPGADWFLTQLFGYFGAGLSAALVLGLDETQIVSTLGLAYMQAAGGKEAGFGVGATGRSIYPAFAAMGGVTAALLSRAGVRGPETALDGAAGLFRIYLEAPPSAAQRALLLAPDGWQCAATQIKPWPSCRLSHPYVSAALALRAQLQGAGVQRMVVAVNASAAKLCAPLADRRHPRTLQDAKYSVPFMTAFALVHGAVDLDLLHLDALVDPAVLAVADTIDIAETLPDRPGHPPAVIDAVTTDGRQLRVSAENFDLDEAGVRAKFDACLAHAGRAAQADALWRRLADLEAQPHLDFLFDGAAAQR
ncbi:MAG: MmgE/PrpD family protein [Comamonas sp.]